LAIPEDSKENLKKYTLRIEESVWKQWTIHNKEIGVKSNSERFRWLVENDLGEESETPAVKFNFAEATSQIGLLSNECKRLLKLIDDPQFNRLTELSKKLGLLADLSNLTETLPKFYTYQVPEYDSQIYGIDEIGIWVHYLTTIQKRNLLKRTVLEECRKSQTP
jgi:hypothetical protein